MAVAPNTGQSIQEQMQRVRCSLGADVRDLVDTAREKTDWRHYVRHYPWVSLGAAAAVGYALVPARPRVIQLDGESAAHLVKSRGMVANVGGHAGNGLMSSLIQMAAKTLLLKGLESLTRHRSAKTEDQSATNLPGSLPPTQIDNNTNKPW